MAAGSWRVPTRLPELIEVRAGGLIPIARQYPGAREFIESAKIYMYHREHGVPHFHALYGEHEAVIAIRGLRVLEGRLPRRALALVRAWGKPFLGKSASDNGLLGVSI